jgi:hypothetical protein
MIDEFFNAEFLKSLYADEGSLARLLSAYLATPA